MKILAIHKNSLFFKNGAPNFYGWICKQRGLSDLFLFLDEIYNEGKEGPKVLLETFRLSTVGLTGAEFEEHCRQYRKEYENIDTKDKILKLSEKMKIFIFTSYPKELYSNFEEVAFRVFGVEPILNEHDRKVQDMVGIHLNANQTKWGDVPKNLGFIKRKMNEFGFIGKIAPKYHFFEHGYVAELERKIDIDRFNIEPDQYGMLVLLLDAMAELGVEKEDVIVVGKGRTAEPMHKVAGRIIESLDEL